MNGVQLTFFNFAGFLIPGIIFSLVTLPALFVIPAFQGMADASTNLLVGPDGTIPTATIATLFLPGLAWSFLVGVLISDTASLLMRQLRRRGWMFYRPEQRSLFRELQQRDWDEALENYPRLREFIAQRATSGWDLYGSAARGRMCTACGFALIISAPLNAVIAIGAGLFALGLGSYLILLGVKKHADYLATVDFVTYAEAHFWKRQD